MRRLVLLAAVGASGALAAPASAADVTIRGFAFEPVEVNIAQGESVTWTFAGPDTNHSVTSDAGQADSWDSDPGRNPTAADHPIGDTFDHRFDVPGTFRYFCKVHPSMRGRVVVRGAGEPPPPADTTAPAISSLTARGGRACGRRARRCKPRPTTVRYSLSEEARVTLAFAARKSGKTRTFRQSGKAGANTLRRSVKQLRPGRYRLTVTAADAAGNVSAPATRDVRVSLRR
jgi:plastocyanin